MSDRGTTGRRAFLARLPWLGAALAAGCAGRDKRRGMTRVAVRSRSPQVVAFAVEQVFRREGFEGDADPTRMLFVRDGGAGSNMAYGGWVSGATTEVEVFLQSLGPELHEVWCEVYQVRHADDAGFADRQRLSRVHAARYRRLLEAARDLVEPGG